MYESSGTKNAQAAHYEFGKGTVRRSAEGCSVFRPLEDEDLDADLILRRRIPLNEIGAKFWNIYQPLRKEGYNVLIGYKFDGRLNKVKTKRRFGN